MLPVAPQFFYQMAQNMGALSSGNECTQEQPAMKYDYYDNKNGVESNGVVVGVLGTTSRVIKFLLAAIK